jgi:uncharacterized protein (TIGR03083 family)
MGIDHVGLVGHEAALLVAVARQGPLDATVVGCPGWDLGRLAGHVGRVHRWATASIVGRAEPDGTALDRPPKGDEVVDWALDAIAPLLDALRTAPAPGSWNFVGADDGDGLFWPRRMAIETSIHRWDAEDAVGGVADTNPLDAQLAAEGIEESLTLLAPRMLAGRDGIDIGGSVHLHCTDTAGEWTLQTDDGVLRVDHGHLKGSVALRGPASSVLLVLYRRLRPGEGATEVIGEADVLDRWLALGV